jgi:putative membrane-bound dehydrogenase-like protein
MLRLSGLLTLAIVAAAGAQHSPEETLSSFRLADPALRIELVAAEPLVESPCAMAFDEYGRMYVAENRGYPNLTDPPLGRVALLSDTDRDGRMDKRSTFADKLTFPNGVLPWRGGVIVTCAPDVLFLKDTDGDGKADERRVLLTGFDTKGSTQLRVNCPTIGPDGWIYLAAGLSGGSITCPEHPDRRALKMTADIRFHPDTLEVENVDGRSQYGMSFDEAGRRFICMNRLPVQHVVISSRLLARNPNLAVSETVQDCSERSVQSGLKGGGAGVRLHPISRNVTTADSHSGSFSAACGIHLWQGESLSLKYQDHAFSCDPTANLVHVDELKLRGATFEAQPIFKDREFLASSDDWFRPVYLSNGPDGALHIVDMTREVIEHPDYLPEEVRKHTAFESGRNLGRIWRVRLIEDEDSPMPDRLAEADTAALVAHMENPIGWVEATAARLLWERKAPDTADMLRKALDERASSNTSYYRLRMLDRMAPLSDDELSGYMQNRDIRIRRAAFEIAHGRVPAGSKTRQVALASRVHSDDDWYQHILLLGEIDESRALDEMAEWLALAGDRWTQAAVFSGIAGRELAFLEAFARHKTTAASIIRPELARLIGRSIPIDQLPRVATQIAREHNDAFLVPFLTEARKRDRKVGLALIDPRGERIEAALREILARNGRVSGRAMVDLLALGEYSKVAEFLLLVVSGPDSEAQAAAISALAGYPNPEACDLLLDGGKWQNYTPSQREMILNALLANPAQHVPALNAIESGRLPASAVSTVRRGAFLKSKDAAIRDRASKLFAAPSDDRQKAFEKAKAVLSAPANAPHGREVFRQLCASCHRLEREGFAVGPDLFDIRNQSKENILFHIIVPDAEIAPAFTSYTIETKDGRGLAGVLASESSTSVTVRMPLGQEESVLRNNIARIEALPNSLMPSGLDAAMKPGDLADLLAFLRGEK